MIQRKNNINIEAAEVSLQISFTSYDVWSWMEHLSWLLHRDDSRYYSFALSQEFTDTDIIHFLSNDSKCLGWMAAKNAEPVARWAIRIAEKQGYLIKEGDIYRLGKRMTVKNGRPKIE